MSSSTSSEPGNGELMIFRPTYDQMKNFGEFINEIESAGAHRFGYAKIIPPSEWLRHTNMWENFTNKVILEKRQSASQLGEVFKLSKKAGVQVNLYDFKVRERYNSPLYMSRTCLSYRELESLYWNPRDPITSVYGGIEGSFCGNGVKYFNPNYLNTILDLLKAYNIEIPGVNKPYIRYGTWGATDALSTEVMDLYGIYYLAYGEPKFWYIIPPSHGRRVEAMIKNAWHAQNKKWYCDGYLSHKSIKVSPNALNEMSVAFTRVVQEPGEFVITFPYAYHESFDLGFNYCESVNFAMERWIEYGKRAHVCKCSMKAPRFPMHPFVKMFQPQKYLAWLAGKDYGFHPEDISMFVAAPKPRSCDRAFE